VAKRKINAQTLINCTNFQKEDDVSHAKQKVFRLKKSKKKLSLDIDLTQVGEDDKRELEEVIDKLISKINRFKKEKKENA
jgi:hypothetical protein